MAKVKPTDQKRDGICYAVAVQALFDAYRLKEDPNAEVSSPHQIAISNAIVEVASVAFRRQIEVDSGSAREVMSVLLREGGCREKFFSSRYDLADLESRLQKLLEMKRKYDDAEMLSKLDVKQSLNYQGLEWMESRVRGIVNKVNADIQIAKRLRVEVSSCADQSLQNTFPETTVVASLQKHFAQESEAEFFTSVDNGSCPVSQRTRVKSKPNISSFDFQSDLTGAQKQELDSIESKLTAQLAAARDSSDRNRFMSAYWSERSRVFSDTSYRRSLQPRFRAFLGQSLLKDGLPVQISYCASRILSSSSATKDGCGSHASLVIGRRWDVFRKTCQILIRNSWGTASANTYRKGVIPDGPNFWIDEDDLLGSPNLGAFTLSPPATPR